MPTRSRRHEILYAGITAMPRSAEDRALEIFVMAYRQRPHLATLELIRSMAGPGMLPVRRALPGIAGIA